MSGDQRHIRVLILYSWESDSHKSRVRGLAARLQEQGFEVELDQFHDAPEDELPLTMKRHITKADFVVTVCTETYRRWFEKDHRDDEKGMGRGVRWEAKIIRTLLYDGAPPAAFVPVLFADASPRDIPIELRDCAWYVVDDAQGFDDLLRHLRSRSSDEGLLEEMPSPEKQSGRPSGQSAMMFPVPFSGTSRHHLPPRNPYFTGRKEELHRVADELRQQGVAMLSGMGGAGKTQTAAQFAHGHQGEYEVIFWMNADTPGDLVAGFARLAALLDLPQKNTEDQNIAADAARRWLAGNDGWLLILDNLDDPELPPQLTAWLPGDRRGHVLITSRLPSAPELGVPRPIEVRKLPTIDAHEFLRKRTGRRDITGDELHAMVNLAEDLGYLPLALEQAAAYILDRDLSFADYRQSYQAGDAGLRQETLDRMPPQIGERQKRPLATTWLLNIAQVEKSSPAASELLRFFACLHSDDIPFELIVQGRDHIGEHVAAELEADDGPLRVADLLAPLRRYSLIEIDRHRRTLSVHRLLQDVVLAKMDEDLRQSQAEKALLATYAAWPWPDYENWAQCERLLPHALAVTKHFEQLDAADTYCAWLLSEAGYFLFLKARYDEADAACSKSVAMGETCLGADHPTLAPLLNALALVQCARGRYSDAEATLLRALARIDKKDSSQHSMLATVLTNLANVCVQQGQWEKALPVFLDALRIRHHELGTDSPRLANTLQCLASQYLLQQSVSLAKMLFLWALSIVERYQGADHPAAIQSLIGLAEICSRCPDELDRAESLVQRALDIAERTWGPDHPVWATCLTPLARIHYYRGKHAEAEQVCQRAMSILSQRMGATHRLVGELMMMLAALCADQERFAEAEPLSQRAIEILSAALGPDHFSVADALELRMELLREMDRESEAAELEARLREMRGASSGETSTPEEPS
jgi:hypothetical protein